MLPYLPYVLSIYPAAITYKLSITPKKKTDGLVMIFLILWFLGQQYRQAFVW